MYVCICKGITEKQVEEASLTSSSIIEVCKKLGVGSECGVCLSDTIASHKGKHQQQKEQKKN